KHTSKSAGRSGAIALSDCVVTPGKPSAYNYLSLEYGDEPKSWAGAHLVSFFDFRALEWLGTLGRVSHEVAARKAIHGGGQVCPGHCSLPRTESGCAQQPGFAAEPRYGAPHGRRRAQLDTPVGSCRQG